MASSMEGPTEDELQVALTLTELAELILAAERWRPPLHALPESLSWGCRKPRSVPGHLHHPVIHPLPPPLLDDKERVGVEGVPTTTTLSPTSPLCFQESGGEDVDGRHRKRDRKQWMEQQREMMDFLSDAKSNSDRVIRDEHKSFLQSSSPNSSFIHEAKQHQMPEVLLIGGGGGGPVSIDPTAVDRQWTAAIATGHGWGWQGVQWPAEEPKSAGAAAVGLLLPDLNERPNEGEVEQEQDSVWGWEQQKQQQMAYRAATSALARRRRLQIQRGKRSSHFYNSSTFY
ncbi:hypothetical protein Cni_G21928 [Canna indica]|uniref:Uncharacterized protein n=1 Tax=Canna indica TaxID=4628 RepID=A0AAQ3KRM3_9LILI|nr:hypothetical protein Cni_G21928 [Canna indica]